MLNLVRYKDRGKEMVLKVLNVSVGSVRLRCYLYRHFQAVFLFFFLSYAKSRSRFASLLINFWLIVHYVSLQEGDNDGWEAGIDLNEVVLCHCLFKSQGPP